MNLTLHNALLYLHIAAGFVSLVLFWLPIATAKGKAMHRKIGTLYVYTMSIVVASAFALSIWRISSGGYQAGLALLFLSMITLLPLVSGIQILKAKKPSASYRRLRVALAVANLIVGAVLLAGWYILSSNLLLVFGLLGVAAGLADIRRFGKETGSGKSWLREHYEGMLFSGAAAYTAFFAFGGSTLLSSILVGWWAILPWILPTLLTFALLPLVHKHYKQTKKTPV